MATLQPAKYGKVIGRLLAVVADGPDEDEYPNWGGFPDAVPVAGSVTFTPRATQILVPLATPSPVTAFPTPITAQLDQNGYLTHNGKKGVFLLCPSSATNPPAFTYSVSYNLTLDGAVIGSTKFDLEMVEYVPGPNPSDPDIGSTAVDLTLVTPVYPTPGTPVVRGPKGDSIVDITLSGDGSALVFHIATETGTVTEPVTIPALGDLTAAVGEAEDARDAAQGFAEGASQSRGRAEAAADLAVSTAAGIQDVADDAAQVALDRVAVAEDRDVVTLDRQAVDDAKGAVEIARDETESFAAIAGAAAAVAVEQAEGGPIELAMAVSAAEFGVPGTDVWYSIPGLDVTVTTGDRPAYVSVDFGIVVTDGVTRPVTSLSPRIWDDTAGVSLATGYMQALNPLPNSDPQYLLTQPPSLGVRLPAGWTNHRLLVQVQIPGDQAGPSWQFNTNWIPTQSSIRVVAT